MNALEQQALQSHNALLLLVESVDKLTKNPATQPANTGLIHQIDRLESSLVDSQEAIQKLARDSQQQALAVWPDHACQCCIILALIYCPACCAGGRAC
jgi:hypothetical protein